MNKSVIIYTRVSTKKQNINPQKRSLIEWAEKNNYNVKMVCGDKASGSIDLSLRSGGKRLISALLKNKGCSLLVFNLDRLTRSYYNSIWIEQFLINNNIKLISLSDVIDFNDPASLLNFRIKNCINAYFISDLKKKQKSGIAAAKERGVYKGRPKGAVGR